MQSEAHLNAHAKFQARSVTWFEPKPSAVVKAIVPLLIGVGAFFLIVLLAVAVANG